MFEDVWGTTLVDYIVGSGYVLLDDVLSVILWEQPRLAKLPVETLERLVVVRYEPESHSGKAECIMMMMMMMMMMMSDSINIILSILIIR